MALEIRKVTGDMFKAIEENDLDAVVHGCNCFHTMGAGVARVLNQTFDDGPLQADMNGSEYGDKDKLGTFTKFTTNKGFNFTVYNAYTQYSTRSDENPVPVEWWAVRKALIGIIEENNVAGKYTHIGIPAIGCGLAGGKLADLLRELIFLQEEYYDIDANIDLTLFVLE